MKARRVINDLVRFDFQLRGLWLLVLCFGLALVVFGFWLEDKDNATVHDLLPKLVTAIGAAASGFASSAFFLVPISFFCAEPEMRSTSLRTVSSNRELIIWQTGKR